MSDRLPPVFLVESPHPWWGVWQRPHQIMSRLARRFPVVYVTPVYGRDLRGQRAAFKRWRDTRDPENGGIRLMAVRQRHGERFAPLLRWNQRAVIQAFRRAAQEHPGRRRILWIYDPHKGYLADAVDHDLLVYDVMDEYSEFPFAPPRIREEEEALLARADQVFAGTWALFERKKALARSIRCCLSKVDAEHFARARTADCPLPPEAAAWRERYECTIGYFGMVDERIDWTLVERMARERPKWGFVFVGPLGRRADDGERRLQRLPENVELLGQRPYAALPGYCRAWDFCWIPFVRNAWTDHINPTKILEYFAAGRPTLSVRIPDVVKCYSDEVVLADSAEEMLERIEQWRLHPDRFAPRLARAAETARRNSWDQLVLDMLADLNIPLP
ncbi:MAG: hypothetical protein Kow0059_02300 [Candidatus Sumerlaeia bacterium]